MSINLDTVFKEDLEKSGAVVSDTNLGGELSGVVSSASLANIRGVPISSDQLSEYEGYLVNGGQLVPKRLVWQTLDTTGGTVQGNFDEGLNLKSIYGSALVDTEQFSSDGEGISYRGGELYVTQLNPYRNIYLTGEVNAEPKDVIRADCSSDTTVSLPTAPQEGDYVVVSVVKGDPITHPVTFGAAHNIEGDTLFQLNRVASIEVVFNGAEWKVFRRGG